MSGQLQCIIFVPRTEKMENLQNVKRIMFLHIALNQKCWYKQILYFDRSTKNYHQNNIAFKKNEYINNKI